LFIENRVKKIQKETDITFCYAPSDQNPADLPTRGSSVSEISEAQLWWHGPTWLKYSENSWPNWRLPQITPEIIKQIQVDTPTVFYEVASVVSCNTKQDEQYAICKIDEKKYSSLRKLLRITVYCLKFI